MYLLILLTFIFSGLNSQQLIDSKKDNPVEIYAEDAIEWHKNEKKYLAIGNAKASSGSMSLTSERIEAFYNEEEDSNLHGPEFRQRFRTWNVGIVIQN